MSALNVFLYVEVEDREDKDQVWYRVDPDKMYPAMVEFIQKKIQKGEVAENPYLAGLLSQARKLPLELALVDKDEFAPHSEKADQRAAALELCRLYFTELLHIENHHAPMGVHILKSQSNKWRL